MSKFLAVTTLSAILFISICFGIEEANEEKDPAAPRLSREFKYWRGAREITPGPFLCKEPAATGVTVTCDRWPDTTDIRRFAEDAVRLSNAKTPHEQALALWRWIRRIKVHTDGNPPTEKCVPSCNRGYVTDPLKVLNVYGAHYCGGLSRVSELIWRARGMRADRIHCGSHSMVDVFYRDDDGVERYHLFDVNFGGFMYHHSRKRLMSLDEYSTDYFGGKYNWIHKEHWPWPKHRMELSFRTGEKLERIWGNWKKPYQSHMDPKRDNRRTPISERGPYKTRTFGNGRWTYTPDLTTTEWQKGLAEAPVGMAANKLMPVSVGTPGFATWHFRTPYIVSDVAVRMKVNRASSDDVIRLHLSVDDGKTWKPVWTCPESDVGQKEVTASICPSFEVKQTTPVPKDLHSPFGRYAFRVKLELVAKQKPEDCRIDGVSFETTVQQNFYALPQLQPGKNKISVRGDVAPGSALKVTYVWEDPKGKARQNVAIVEKAPHSYEILAAGKKWEDVVCRSILVECIAADGKGNRTEIKEEPSEIHELAPMQHPKFTRGRRGWWQRSELAKLPKAEQLIKELADAEKRSGALKGLLELRDPAAFDAIKRVCYEEKNVHTKSVALVALFVTDREKSKTVLLDILEHPEKAAWTDKPVKKGPQDAKQHYANAAVIIGLMAKEAGWKEAIPGLLKVMAMPEIDQRKIRKGVSCVPYAIMRIFASIGDKRIAEAARKCVKYGGYRGAYAALAAAHIGDKKAIPDIRKILAGSFMKGREYAAVALGRLGDLESAPAIRQMLKEFSDENHRAAAAEALGAMRDKGSREALKAALDAEPFPWVRAKMKEALAKLE